jgi:hypothetical protein
MSGSNRPDVSVAVVVFNMAREAPRTLLSLSAAYQRHIAAVNRGLAEARGDVIGVMIDGARMVTPGLLHFARTGARLYARTVLATLTWHLGFDMQWAAIDAGYDRAQEDALLASIGWSEDGYRLFDIATLAGSSADGWFLPISESNALFLGRASWEMLGGLDERFDRPGGGLVNLDTYRRALELPDAELALLLGEGTFHQMHGGMATNAKRAAFKEALGDWLGQYKAIRGQDWATPRPRHDPTYLGRLPRNVLPRFARSALFPARSALGGGEPPLGRSFDRELWTSAPPVTPADPLAAALVAIAHREMRAGRFEMCAAVARIGRRHFPNQPELLRLLALLGPTLPSDPPPADRAAFERVTREVYELLANRTDQK